MTDTIFHNEALIDLSRPENAVVLQSALADVRTQFGKAYPLVIGAERIETETTLDSINPAHPEQVVGRVALATAEHVDAAIEAAEIAFQTWRRVPAAPRAEFLLRIADELRRHRAELTAWIIYEVSKTWGEADAEVAEAIDCCEFYALAMLALAEPHTLPSGDGERGELFQVPLGPGVIMPHWNFPLAGLVGATSAALVAGNTVIIKPSPRAAVVAAKFMDVIDAVSLPDGAINMVPGHGNQIGDALIDHPLVRFIAYTGAPTAGLRVGERAARRQPEQNWLKRAMIELGGKGTIIVDETADLEAAAIAIVDSAFGFQGQKRSACTRVVAVHSIYGGLLDKLAKLTEALKVGDPALPATDIGAIIDERALEKITRYFTIGEQEGRLITGGTADAANGYFAQPTIYADVAPDARLAQEEIFGPVLAYINARDFDQALAIANNTEYGLTGGVYSRNRGRIDRAREMFHVGNLYINRKITGAQVGAHPFGGFNMSGMATKAGSASYLSQFLQAKVVAEKL